MASNKMSKEEEEEKIIPIPAEYQETFKKFAKRHEYWKENIRPKWKAIKKTRALIDAFLMQPANNITISYDDMLNSFVKTGNALRKKMNKKNFKVKSDDYGGETLGQALKFLDALAMYDKYRAEGSDATPAMKRVLRLKRFDWSLGSLKRNLSKARRLPSDLGAVQAKRAKIALKGK